MPRSSTTRKAPVSRLVDSLRDVTQEVILSRDKSPSKSKSIWEEKPVDFRTFVESPVYMDHPPLSDEQRLHMERFLGTDPNQMFASSDVDVNELKKIIEKEKEESENKELKAPDMDAYRREEESVYHKAANVRKNIAVLLLGKGSGKDTMATLAQLYVVYLLLCMKSIHSYFGRPRGDSIDAINVSTSGKNAKLVYFNMLQGKLLSAPWFRNRFKIYAENRVVNPDDRKQHRLEIKIKSDIIEFPKHIRAISGTSVNEYFEGTSPIFFALDEASGFIDGHQVSNADKIYDSLCTSASTRFGTRFKGMILSYPRQDDDFTIRAYIQGMKYPHIYAVRRYTWEMLPARCYRGETFEFEGLQIPVEHYNDFATKPRKAKQMLMCIPMPAEGAWIEDPMKIRQCVDSGREPILTVVDNIIQHRAESGEEKLYIGKMIQSGHVDQSLMQYAFAGHVDLGLRQDSAAFTICHAIPVEVEVRNESGELTKKPYPMIIHDITIEWQPNKKQNLEVSTINVADIVLEIAKIIPLKIVSYDQWNSSSSIERLQQHLQVDEHNIDNDDYEQFESLMNMGLVKMLNCEKLVWELERLKIINGKIDHDKSSSKDLADSLVGAIRLLVNAPEKMRKYLRHRKYPSLQRVSGPIPGRSNPYLAMTPLAPQGGQVQIVSKNPMQDLEQALMGGPARQISPVFNPLVMKTPRRFPSMRSQRF